MSRITDAFKNGKAFIPFITAGDPNLDITIKLVPQMAKAGADIIELGIPFSDPVAEGILIQQADERALAAGTTTDEIFDAVKEIRKQTDIPLVFMTYVNPVYVYGPDKFFNNCAKYGIDGVIIPDLPYEEKDEIYPFSSKYNIDLISIIAPISKERIQMIAKDAQGFVYCISSMDANAEKENINTKITNMINMVKEIKNIPCAVGVDISISSKANEMALITDGIIDENIIVEIIHKHGCNCIEPIVEYIKNMKSTIKKIGL